MAAAILYEGYILYPYRPSAVKNRQRWNFGTLYPQIYAEAQRPQEPFHFIAECLVEGCTEDTTLDVKLQFLRLFRRTRATETPEGSSRALTDPSLAWEEAIECESELHDLRLGDLIASPVAQMLQLSSTGPVEIETTSSMEGLSAMLTITLEQPGNGLWKVRLHLRNASLLASGKKAKREEALPLSFVSAHVLLKVHGGQFVSLLDPSEMHREAAAGCGNVGVFPVLAGVEPDRTLMLCSPIILYDYPKIAAESAGDFFDGTEMDEMLTLRVLTLTDAEKQEMRDGDPRARQILERTEALTPETMMKAHGTIRGMREIRGGTR